MSHLNYTTKNRKGKHLNYEERIKTEALSKIGLKSEAIAKQIGCSGRTVRRELAKGRSISERPKIVDSREKYGNWEMDTVSWRQKNQGGFVGAYRTQNKGTDHQKDKKQITILCS